MSVDIHLVVSVDIHLFVSVDIHLFVSVDIHLVVFGSTLAICRSWAWDGVWHKVLFWVRG